MKVAIRKTMKVQGPTRAHSTDAGLDLHVPAGQGRLVRPGAVYTINLGVRAAIPDGYYGQLVLRSSAAQRGLVMPNGVGIIDSGYRGDLKLPVIALVEPVLIATDERICQLIIHAQPPVEVEEGVVEDDTDRGRGGFGSTGTGAAVHGYSPQATGRLTIGALVRRLQDAASQYGNDTPVAVLAGGGVDYEQAAALSVVNAVKTGCVGGWDQYRADADGAPTAVIS